MFVVLFLFIEKKIIIAAKDVAETLSGDKTKTTSDLLQKVLESRVETLREEQAKMYVDYHISLNILNCIYYI